MSKPRAGSAHAAPGDPGARSRPESRNLVRRIAAALTAVALGAGLALVGVAAPASAHHNTITASAACSADGKTATVTWKVTNSENLVEEITDSSLKKVVPKGETIASKATEEFVQTGVKLGEPQTLTLSAKWSNGQTKTDSWTYTPASDLCGGGGDGDKVCPPLDTGHLSAGNAVSYTITAPEGQLIAEVCVKAGSTQQGNGPESTTLSTPSKTTTISHSSGKQISHYSVRYVDAPKVVTIEVVPTSVDVCGVANDTFSEPVDTDAIDWTRTGSVAEGKVVLTAVANTGFVFAEGAKTVWTFDFTNIACPEPPKVVTIEVVPTSVDVCGVANDTFSEPVDTDAIDWTRTGSVAEGKVVLTAVAKAGYVFAEGAKTVWTFDFTNIACPEPPKVVTIEVVPTSVDVCGVANDTFSEPVDTDAIDWTRTGSVTEGKVVLTAVAKTGFVFAEGAKTVWTFDFTNIACPEPPKVVTIEVVPTSVDVCGVANDTFSEPVDTDAIDWTRTGSVAEGKVVLTAVAKAGYVFAEDAKTVWTFDFTNVGCVAPTLTGSVATGVCEADLPWITYSVALTDPDEQATSRLVALVLSDGTNSERLELGELGEDNTLTGKVLWPGASVAEDGVTPTGWPGWEKIGDAWVETDGNFAWTRGITTASFEVNPTLAVSLAYPEATPDCATGPKSNATTAAAGGGAGLASTGFAGTTIAIVAGIIVIAGIAFLVIARIRRKRA